MKKGILTLITILSLVLLTACATEKTEETSEPAVKDGHITITNTQGEEITVPQKIDKIVSMAPTFTEVIVALGRQDNLVAIDTYSDYIEGLPADVKHVDMMTPDVELLMSLEPDVVLVSAVSTKHGNEYYSKLENEGTTVVYIPSSSSIEGIYSDLMFMSTIFGEEEKGQEIVDDMKAKIAEIEEKGKTITDKKSVYFEIGESPNLYTFGKNVYLDEILNIIGAKNIIDDKEGWTSISEEIIIDRNPDVIITNISYIEDPVQAVKDRAGWQNMNAIKDNAVYYVDNMSSSHSNHTIIKALEEIAKAVYPDIY